MLIKEILELKFKNDDFKKELTIKEYLKELLKKLWNEQEGFSGKRPFGNSGWDWFAVEILVKEKVISGNFNDDGYVEDFDEEKYNKIILNCIKGL